MIRRILLSCLVFSLTACGAQSRYGEYSAPEALQNPPPPESKPPGDFPWFSHPKFSVQGHRGARKIFPENTIPAFEYALQVEADQLEMDITITKDGVPVISHDPVLSKRRCLNPDGSAIEKPVAVRSLTLEEVKKYDCGSVVTSKMPLNPVPHTSIPTFDEVIELVLTSKHPAAQKLIFKVDIKSTEDRELYPTQAEIAKTVLQHVHAYGIQNRTIYSSFDVVLLKELRAQDPKSRLAYLTAAFLKKKDINTALALKAETFSPYFAFLLLQGPARWTKRIQNAGLRVVPWTVDKEKSWKRLIESGVNGILTDDPAGLRAFYNHHKETGGRTEPTEAQIQEEMEALGLEGWDL